MISAKQYRILFRNTHMPGEFSKSDFPQNTLRATKFYPRLLIYFWIRNHMQMYNRGNVHTYTEAISSIRYSTRRIRNSLI